MEVVWTAHALLMMQERDVLKEWAEQAIDDPQQVEIDPAHPERKRIYKRIEARGGRWLRVVYEKTEGRITVIMVFFDRNAGKWP